MVKSIKRYKLLHLYFIIIIKIFEYSKKKMSQALLRRKVAIVGCGPVGMLASLLF